MYHNIKTSDIVSVEDLVALEVTMQPRSLSDHDMRWGTIDAPPDTYSSNTYLNECVHCQSNGIHRPANWSVTYAGVEVLTHPRPRLEVKRRHLNEGVCNDHIKDVMENIRDYYQDQLYVLREYVNDTSLANRNHVKGM